MGGVIMAEGVNVRISGKLKTFISEQAGPHGLYESASEYVRDLIRRDFKHHEDLKWNMLFEKLAPAMKAEENDFISFKPEKIIKFAKKQKAENAV
jgi:antitoxin ParD1/3/4